ncbi:MAG: helix-turn-helix domain-containing protein [Pseudomonadota bacterium]
MVESFSATIVLLRGYPLLSLSLLTEPWRTANQLAGKTLATWALTTWKGDNVKAASGEELVVSRPSKTEDESPSLVLVIGGETLTRAPEKALLTWLKKADADGSLVAGIGAGADVLEKAGLLEAGGGSVPIDAVEAFQALNLNPALAHGRYAIYGKRAACAGGMATLDFSLALVDQMLGSDLAERTAALLTHQRRPSELERLIPAETMKRADPRLVIALRRLSALLTGEAAGVKAAAKESSLSERQLLRLFHDTFGMAPRRYQEAMRLERARTLLADSNLTIYSIALAVGFAGGPELSRAYQRHYQESPTTFRKRVRAEA